MLFSDAEKICMGFLKKDFRAWEKTGSIQVYDTQEWRFTYRKNRTTMQGREYLDPVRVMDMFISIKDGKWYLLVTYIGDKDTESTELRIPLVFDRRI